MQPRVPVTLTLALLLAAVGAAASAQAPALPITVVYNGAVLPTDPAPVEYHGRVLIGMRDIFEAMRASIRWDTPSATVTATQGSTTVVLTIGKTTAYVNGQAVALDVAPQMVNDRTMIPLRFVAEASGAKVRWLPESRTIEISTGAPSAPGPGEAPGPPQVDSPANDQQVGPSVDVRGRTVGGATVRIVTTVFKSETKEKVAEVPGIRRNVWADGRFDVSVALPSGKMFPAGTLYYEIRVTAIVGGAESPPTVIRVTRRNTP